MGNLLILSDRFDNDSNDLRREALKLGWRVERVKGYNSNHIAIGHDKVVIYGAPLFCEVMAKQTDMDLHQLPLNWLSNLPTEYTSRKIRLSTPRDMRDSWFPAFVKPAFDKSFPATVYGSRDLVKFQDKDEPIFVSGILKMDWEVRCFVQDKKVVTSSVYAKDGFRYQPEDGEELSRSGAEFLDDMLQDKRIRTPIATVIDVAYVNERGWVVIEANPAWCSGLYDCDVEQVLSVLDSSCTEKAT